MNAWYHLVKKGTNMKKGIVSPYYMSINNMSVQLSLALNKYRGRMCDEWNIYPNKDPNSLTNDQIMNGLNKYRGKYGTKCIYLFRYPPYPEMGKYMKDILTRFDIYRVNLDKVNDIIYIDYNLIDAKGKEWYDNVSELEYFSKYDENTKGLLFATIPHVALVTRSGRIHPDAITRISKK